MEKTTYKSYWETIRRNSKDKTNKKLGTGIRLLAIIVGLIATTIKSISSGGNLNAIFFDLLGSFSIIIFLWVIVWLSFFVYYRAHESVILYNDQEEKNKRFRIHTI